MSDAADLIKPAEHLREFLRALGSINCELGEHLEESSSAISRLLMGSVEDNQALVVELQAFDRLRQEILAIGETLQKCAELISPADHADEIENLIAGISLSRLRTRLLPVVSTSANDAGMNGGPGQELEF